MDWISTITFDQLAYSILMLGLIREGMVFALPDTIAGPGGWLIDTQPED
ncbi:hypothetical protein Ga0609869_002808 [Rhodovulum iodosum]|uniref:Uncharacterized protein n=1 Tax=Rhodovulum iodosum TaxID=68291 RepID=A0ABV3XVS5_9RHOB|nr:hypothetical protein [Rhodovulum robiginosum]